MVIYHIKEILYAIVYQYYIVFIIANKHNCTDYLILNKQYRFCDQQNRSIFFRSTCFFSLICMLLFCIHQQVAQTCFTRLIVHVTDTVLKNILSESLVIMPENL